MIHTLLQATESDRTNKQTVVRSSPGRLHQLDHLHLYDSNRYLAYLPYCSLNRKEQLGEAATDDNQQLDVEAVVNFELQYHADFDGGEWVIL